MSIVDRDGVLLGRLASELGASLSQQYGVTSSGSVFIFSPNGNVGNLAGSVYYTGASCSGQGYVRKIDFAENFTSDKWAYYQGHVFDLGDGTVFYTPPFPALEVNVSISSYRTMVGCTASSFTVEGYKAYPNSAAATGFPDVYRGPIGLK